MRCSLGMCVVVVVSMALAGCSGAGVRSGGKPTLVQASHKTKPDWARKGTSDYVRDNRVFFVGCSSEQASRENLKGTTLRAATEALAGKITTEVKSECVLKEEFINGQTDVQLTCHSQLNSVPFKVKDRSFEGFYWEEWTRGGTPTFRGCIVISLPTKSLKDAIRMAKGAVMVAWNCQADKGAECAHRLLDPIRVLVSKLGSKLLPTVKDTTSSENACPLGIRHDAAFVLFIDLEARFNSEVHGEFYAYSDANADMIETFECTSQTAVEIERQKGGQFTAKDAVVAAMRKAVDELADELGYRLKK